MEQLSLLIADAALVVEWHDVRPVARWVPHAPRQKSSPPTALWAKDFLTLVRTWERAEKLNRKQIEAWLPNTPPFLAACWRAALAIPRGETRTYAWLAHAAGRPTAHRAAAQAMARNPLPLLVPCHRVVGMNDAGGFCGFKHSTLDTQATHWAARLKARLLEVESKSNYVSYTPAPQGRASAISRKKL